MYSSRRIAGLLGALTLLSTACPEPEPAAVRVEPCPDPEAMYRDQGRGGVCACISPERFVLSNDGLHCVECLGVCDDQECGDDGCGRACGYCRAGTRCEAEQCVTCAAGCEGRACGDDGCGGSCGSCGAGSSCANGQCSATTPPAQTFAPYCCTPSFWCWLVQPLPANSACMCPDMYGFWHNGLACLL